MNLNVSVAPNLVVSVAANSVAVRDACNSVAAFFLNEANIAALVSVLRLPDSALCVIFGALLGIFSDFLAWKKPVCTGFFLDSDETLDRLLFR
jgi:hypothetical protein